MSSEASLNAQSESFGAMGTGAAILDAMQAAFASLGAEHFLASGMPFPGRPIDPLLLRLQWGELRGDRRTPLKGSDAVLQNAFRGHRATIWMEGTDAPLAGESALLEQLPGAGRRRLILVPVCSFLPYQAVVVGGGGPGINLSPREKLALEDMCRSAFANLFRLGYVRPERPGELSGRERRVVELSAEGKTAGEIAEILEISQRTVHAHLQNASEKLRAQNKTHTVVEALRYGQISV